MRLNKRKVLIISYAWPPMENVGMVRAVKFAKYLPENNWEPVVLTVNAQKEGASESKELDSSVSQNVKIFRTEYKDFVRVVKKKFHDTSVGKGKAGKRNKIKSFFRGLITMPDDQIGWYRFAIRDGMKIIKKENISALFSTSPPETAHLIARRLKKCYGIPWVADFRDLWADDHYRTRPVYKKMVLKLIERKVLSDADAVVTVSQPWAEKLRSSMGKKGDTVTVIENGFDEGNSGSSVYGRQKNKKFTITYTGKLHKTHQPPALFFKVLHDLISEDVIDRNKIVVEFFITGHDKPDISSIAKGYGLDDVVRECERVSYEKSLEIQRLSDALLFVQWQGRGGNGWYSAKLYDYIGSRRPIIAVLHEKGIIDDLIKRTSSGITVYGEKSMRDAILQLYRQYVSKGFINYEGNNREISRHTRRLRAKDLAGILDTLV